MSTEEIYSGLVACYRELLLGINDIKAEGDPSNSVPDMEMEAWGFAQAVAVVRLLLDYRHAPNWELIQETAQDIEKENSCHE